MKSLYGVDELFILQEGRCYLCGGVMHLEKEWDVAKATIDHVVPLSKGGTNEDDNRKAAHRGCNTWKRDALLSDLSACWLIG